MPTKSFLQKKAYTRISMAIFVGVMLTSTLLIVSVQATPITVTASPSSGPVGSTITVSGEDASSNGEVKVYLEGFMWFTLFMATTTANATGGYSVNITVPTVPADTYNVVVFDATTGDANSTNFTVEPKIVLTPGEGSYDDTITLEGDGFQSFSIVTIRFNETDVTPWPQPWTDGLGSFEASFNVPYMSNGTYPVTASDGINNASALFTVIPKITLSPKTSGPPSTLVAVTGMGFAPSVNVTVEFGTINVTNYGGTVTWLDGSFVAIFLVPEVPDETHIVSATDDTGNSATAPFVVPSPVLTLTPNVTFGTSMITATGSGFPPNGPVLLYLEDNLMVNLVDLMTGSQTLFADEYGSYEYSFFAPVAKPGAYKVVAFSPAEDGELTIGEELASALLTIVQNPTLDEIEGEITTIIGNLTAINSRLVSIDGTMATIETDIGTIQANLTAINAKLVSIDGTMATIETDIGTIQADLTDINARVVSIDGNLATVETDIGTIKTDVGDIQAEVVPTGYEFGLLATILALIAAIGAWLSAIFIRKKPIQLFETEKPKKKPKSE